MAKKPKNEIQDDTPQLEQQWSDAASSGNSEKIKHLAAQGVQVDSRDSSGKTALMLTGEAGQVDSAQALLDLGADVNAVDNDGFTASMYAALDGHLDVLKLFASRGADVSIRNNKGLTAQDLAEEMGETAVLTYLASLAAGSPAPAESDTPTNLDDDRARTIGSLAEDTDVEDDKSEEIASIDLEVVEPEEFEPAASVEERGNILAAGTSLAAAPAQKPSEAMSVSFSLRETTEALEELSPDYFQAPQILSLDEIGQLVDDAEQESDDKQKDVSKIISIQFALQPGLAKEMKDRKDFRHAGTIGRMKKGGDTNLKLGKAMNTAPLSSSDLQELSKCPTDQIMFDIARKAIAEKLSVRDIRKLVAPFVRRAKMETSGALADMSPHCVEIIEALEDPSKLMQRPKLVNLLRDSDRLKDEFTFAELSRIHEQANAAQTKIEKQKRALVQKGEGYVPVINFLRLIRKTISAVWGESKS